MKFASLFSGIGGFDLGFERAGMTCAAQVEYDQSARAVLQRHFPTARMFTDVRDVNGADIGSVDLVCGGFPCQDVSIAGRRAGLAGERSSLWFEFHRIVDECRPQFVVIENVPGLLSSNRGRDFAAILQGLAKCGYRSCWRILDSQYFRVPQRRRRLFVVGSLGDGRAAEILFERENSGGDALAGRDARPVTTAVFEGSTGTDGGGRDERYIPAVAGTLQSGGSGSARVGGNVNQKDLLVEQRGLVRRLTPTECERLQGFPDGWTSGQSDGRRYIQLGNAVTVNVAEWIGRRIMEAAR